MRVLVVDDDVDFAESLADLLEIHGHSATLAHTGEDAVSRFGSEDFDIAFMDVKLPGKNGVESFIELKRLKPQARVAMMTGFSVEQLLVQAVNAGALGVLQKPVDTADVLKLLGDRRPDSGTVLIAEDDRDVRESLIALLEDHGYTVAVASTGTQALEKATDGRVCCLVLDLRLPGMSGFEVFMELRSRGMSIPTVIVTGFADEESTAIQALSLGTESIAGCLVKPFDPDLLLDYVARATASKA